MRSVHRLGLAVGALAFTVALAGPAFAAENTFPIANDDYYVTTVDTPFDVPAPGFLANDYDPEGVALYTSVLFPLTPGGTATFGSDGAFHFTPDPGFVGDVTFRYFATDNHDSSPATIHVAVAKPNLAPVATDDSFEAVAGETLRIPASGVLGNDYDPEGGPLTAMLENCSGRQQLEIRPDGALVYTPAADAEGLVFCRYIAIDETNLASPAGLTFKVRRPTSPEPPKAPVAKPRPGTPTVTG